MLRLFLAMLKIMKGCEHMVGDRIRHIRKTNRMTLQALADKTSFSVGFLSQVERGLTEPSLSALRKISDALEVSLYMLLEQGITNAMTVKSDRRALIKLPNSSIQYEVVSPMASDNYLPASLVVQFQIEAGGCDSDDYLHHDSEEIVVILEGELDIDTGGVITHMSQGDSILIKPNTPHRTENNSDHPVKGLCVLTPMSWPA